MVKYIIHVDMDAFFTSVEQRDDPGLKGRPVVVGSDPKGGTGRGVVAACSYEAREFGIRSAMPISTAYRKCPEAAFLPVDMPRYAEASDMVFSILDEFTPDIEPISIDEAFLDISATHVHFGGPEGTCLLIKKTIKERTGLTASIGLAPNKMTAKIASDIKKPDGLMIVGGSEVKSFLFPLPVGKLWGVGEKTEIVMKGLGIGTIGDIAKMSPAEMERVFGKNGVHMWQLANGIDERGVERTADPARSVSNEHTFEEDTGDLEAVKNMIMTLSEKVAFRLRASSLKCGSVILKIRFQDFKTFSKAARLSAPSNFISDIYRAALSKLGEFRIDMDNKVRLIGVGTSGFNSSGWQYDLFEDSSASNRKKEKIHKAMEELKDKFGSGSIGYRSKKDRD